MLNYLFHGHLGFHNGVRVSAGLICGLLILANLLMKPRLSPTSKKEGSTFNDLKTFARDGPYVLTAFGSVWSVSYFRFTYLIRQEHCWQWPAYTTPSSSCN